MISIHKPKEGDAPAIHDVIKKSWYATYVDKKIGITKADINLIYADDPESQIQALRHRAINPKEDDISFVAKESESVVGYIRLKIFETTIELITMYVYPQHSGKSVGTLLWLEALKELPKDKPVIVEVASYTKVIEFYKKIGFVDTGERYANTTMLSSGVQMPLMKMVYEIK